MIGNQIGAAPTEATPLSAWGKAMDRALRLEQPAAMLKMAQVVLQRLPRHLATYQRVLDACWQRRAWAEGETWGRRLLQADPGNVKAWRALARSAEHRGNRAQAEAWWQRAFEHAPFDADVRVGLARTRMDGADPLELSQACLAALRLRAFHWGQAAAIYRPLVEATPERLDYVIGYMVAFWRHGQNRNAYGAARYLVRQQPYILLAWTVLAATGDDNDRALALSPQQTMDPDGEFVRMRLRLELAPPVERKQTAVHGEPYTLLVTPQEAALLA